MQLLSALLMSIELDDGGGETLAARSVVGSSMTMGADAGGSWRSTGSMSAKTLNAIGD